MKPTSSYRAWLCDLDGTLYRAPGLKLLMGLELLLFGWPQLKIVQEFRREHERLRASSGPSTTMSPFDEQVARTAELLGRSEVEVRLSVERWMIQRPARWLARFRRDELVNEIAAFRKAGGKTAVVSDYPAERKLRALGITKLFDVVVASGEPDGPRRLKPEPDGYLKAASKLAVQPAECLVTGDREDTDGAAARAAGMAFRLVR